MKNDLVHAIAKLTIPHGLEAIRILCPPIVVAEGCKGFTRNDLLSVDMGRDGGFLGIVLPALPSVLGIRFATEPEFALGNINFAQALNLVHLARHTDAWGFRLQTNATLVQQLAEFAVEILRNEIAHGATVVPQKPLGQMNVSNDATGERDQPLAAIIAPALGKLLQELFRPSLATGLPAIHIDINEDLAGQRP